MDGRTGLTTFLSPSSSTLGVYSHLHHLKTFLMNQQFIFDRPACQVRSGVSVIDKHEVDCLNGARHNQDDKHPSIPHSCNTNTIHTPYHDPSRRSSPIQNETVTTPVRAVGKQAICNTLQHYANHSLQRVHLHNAPSSSSESLEVQLAGRHLIKRTTCMCHANANENTYTISNES